MRLSVDRLSGDDLVIANMRGVGREGVTEAAGNLHGGGLIKFAAQPHCILIATVCTFALGRSRPRGASSFRLWNDRSNPRIRS